MVWLSDVIGLSGSGSSVIGNGLVRCALVWFFGHWHRGWVVVESLDYLLSQRVLLPNLPSPRLGPNRRPPRQVRVVSVVLSFHEVIILGY